MKIGILTLFHKNYNWGGVLQGYALKTLLETEFSNVQADLLNYSGKNIVYQSKLQQARQYTPLAACRKIITKLRCNDSYQEKLTSRYSLFDAFMKDNTTNLRKYNDETLIEAAQEYDCLISGSDQVWNPNVGCAGFFQEMIGDECKKLAYAASIARDDLSAHERKVMIPLIERFDAVSVRERTAKRILEKYSGDTIKVAEVLDPTMMLPRETWNRVAQNSTMNFEGQYAVAFFFSDSLQYRRQITEYCRKRNLRLKFIPFAQGSYLPADEKGEADRLYGLGPEEFVNLFQNAQCVFTDSFHGCVFSIIFRKMFCVFERDKKSKVSKNSRLYDLLEKFNLSDRLIADVSQMEPVMENLIDYDRVNALQEQFKKESLDFLRNALSVCEERKIPDASHVGEMKKEQCSGCGLCATQCPKKCIEMCQDEEGFFYPHVDEENCVECGYCRQLCRQKNSMEKSVHHDAYIGFHKNDQVRAKSSSGGLFYELATQVLHKGGCVYGAAYAEDFSVKHIRVDRAEDLPRLMTSKYVQSQTDGIFEYILSDLKQGREVLFSGTPCQVGAVNYYVKNNYKTDRLILVDFICHGVPSPGTWQSYIKYLEDTHGSKMEKVSFRDKSKGWHDFHLKADMTDRKILQSHDINAYMCSFLSDRNLRKSCYDCAFKDGNYVSDITLGDAWKIEQDYPQWADDQGTSLFIVRTSQGQEMIDRITDEFCYRKTDYTAWARMNPSLIHSTKSPVGRAAFFQDYSQMDTNAFWKKYSKMPTKKCVRYGLKRLSKVLGIQKVLRKFMK